MLLVILLNVGVKQLVEITRSSRKFLVLIMLVIQLLRYTKMGVLILQNILTQVVWFLKVL